MAPYLHCCVMAFGQLIIYVCKSSYRIGYYSCHNLRYMNISFDEKPMTFSLHLETFSYCGAICDVHFRTILHTARFACLFPEISIQNIKDVFLVDRG